MTWNLGILWRLARTAAPWVLIVLLGGSALGLHEHLPSAMSSGEVCLDHHHDDGCGDLDDCTCLTPAALLPDGTWGVPALVGHGLRHALTDHYPPTDPSYCPEPPPAQLI